MTAKEAIEQVHIEIVRFTNRKHTMCGILERIAKFSLSETYDINPAGDSLWINVFNREDLQTVMALAPVWTKAGESKSLSYNATISEVFVCIKAFDSALPPTCRVVTETMTVPAKEAHTFETTRIVCDLPSRTA